MKKTPTPEPSDTALFRSEFTDVRPIKQDKIPPQRLSSKHKSADLAKKLDRLNDVKQRNATFQFSDGFEGHFDSQQPLKYVQLGADSFEVKRLRRGEYPPDLILDLHGLNKEQVDSLYEEGIYLTGSSRINLAALNGDNIDRFIECIKK